jgi:hypothetical protein
VRAETLFVNGVLLTQNPEWPAAEALAVAGGRIAAVGARSDVERMAGPGTRRVDLAGRTLVPGFNDAHAHLWKLGQLQVGMVDLRRVAGLGELQEELRERERKLAPGEWLLGRGYNEALLKEGRQPLRHDLDAVSSERPIFLTRTCGHMAAVNGRALALGGVTPATADPPGGTVERDRGGLPTGVLRETAVGLVSRVMPALTATDYESFLLSAAAHQLQRGITSSSDCGVRPELLAVYRDLDGRGALPLRVNVMPLRRADGVPGDLPLPALHRSSFLRVDTVKFLADGGLSGATAKLSLPYRHADGTGIMRFETGELLQLVQESAAAGFRIAVHAIGDQAIECVLTVLERAGGGLRRPRIEHFALPDRSHLERARRLRAVAVPQPVFLHSLGENFRRYLPEPLLGRTYPIRSMLRSGLTVALSSDTPVVDEDDPLLGMRAAIERRDGKGELIAPEESLTAAEALRAYTMGGALATEDEGNRGSLEVGKWADLAVLSDNPLAVDPRELTEIRVDMTFVGGKLAYER